jgi:hypothetical protein
MELTHKFLLQKAAEYKKAANEILTNSFEFLNSVENSGLLVNDDWVKEILLSNNYRYFNACVAYNEVLDMLKEVE